LAATKSGKALRITEPENIFPTFLRAPTLRSKLIITNKFYLTSKILSTLIFKKPVDIRRSPPSFVADEGG
jgi:hypothetical protein